MPPATHPITNNPATMPPAMAPVGGEGAGVGVSERLPIEATFTQRDIEQVVQFRTVT